MPELNDLSKELTSIKADMAKVNTLVDRLDFTIEKLSEVSTNISQLLAVQENRLSQLEKVSVQLSSLIEKRKDEVSETAEQLHRRITGAEKDFKAEIEKMDVKLFDQLKQMREENKKQYEELNKKMAQLEKWMWVVTGGAAVVGFILSQLFNFLKIMGIPQ